MQRIPTLVGISGHFKDEIFRLQYGTTSVVGRSRDADFSLKRTKIYRAQSTEQRDADESAQTVSAKHFEVTMFNLRSIEVKNLSPNGIVVDGRSAQVAAFDDVNTRTHEIRFGTEEVLRLEMREYEEGSE